MIHIGLVYSLKLLNVDVFFFYRENTPEKQSTEQVSGYFILLWCG